MYPRPRGSCFSKRTRFLRKWMVDAIARSVDPPDFLLRSFRRECVQHRHHRSRAHTSAQENHRTLAWTQSKASPGCTHIQCVAFSHAIAQKRTSNPVQFALDADAEMIRCRQIRQRIAPKNRWFVRVEMQAQNNKLTRLEDGKRLPIDWPQNEGSYAIAFLLICATRICLKPGHAGACSSLASPGFPPPWSWSSSLAGALPGTNSANPCSVQESVARVAVARWNAPANTAGRQPRPH